MTFTIHPRIPIYDARFMASVMTDACGVLICAWRSVSALVGLLHQHGHGVSAALGWIDPTIPDADLPDIPGLPMTLARARDVIDPREADAPTWAHVQQLLDAARAAPAGTVSLVFCHAAIARSTATAMAIIADRRGPGSEAAAVAAVLAQRPMARPNSLITQLADGVLERRGRLVRAVEEGVR